MQTNEAYNLGVEFGKKVGAKMAKLPNDTVEKFVKSGRALCGTEVFSSSHPLAHVEHDDAIKAAFHRGEQDGLKQVFSERII